MSMRDEMGREIRRQCEEGELVLVEPTIPCSQIRPIYMARKAYARVFGPSAEESARMGFLEADLRRFISGDKIILRKPGDPEDVILDVILRLNEDGTIDSPFGKLRKRASRAMNPVAPY